MRDITSNVDSVFNSLLINSPCFIISAAILDQPWLISYRRSKFGNRQVSNSGALVFPSRFTIVYQHRHRHRDELAISAAPTRFFHSNCSILHTTLSTSLNDIVAATLSPPQWHICKSYINHLFYVSNYLLNVFIRDASTSNSNFILFIPPLQSTHIKYRLFIVGLFSSVYSRDPATVLLYVVSNIASQLPKIRMTYCLRIHYSQMCMWRLS
jgi:hypothetical protein